MAFCAGGTQPDGVARLSRAAAFTLLAIVAPSRTLLAQPSGSVGPGTRVRITISSTVTVRELGAMVGADSGAPHLPTAQRTIIVPAAQGTRLVLPEPGATFVGVLVTVDGQLLSIKADRVLGTLTIPRAAIARLERADGRRSRARYAGFGALLGFGGGALAGFASESSCGPNEWFCSPERAAFAGGIVGAGAGAVIGAIIPPAERWTSLDPISLTTSPPPEPPAASKPQKPPRVTITVQTGQSSSGPAHDVEEAMRLNFELDYVHRAGCAEKH